jgi:hypothetical protein
MLLSSTIINLLYAFVKKTRLPPLYPLKTLVFIQPVRFPGMATTRFVFPDSCFETSLMANDPLV